jgi:hypothetical protein
MPPTPRSEPKAETSSKKTTATDPPGSSPKPLIIEDAPQPAIGVRARQFPALFGSPDVEVAERTIDHGTEPTSVHTKDFVTLRRDYGTANKDEVHENNKRAVRQYMVSQGLRPDAKVEFEGEHDHPFDETSIVLRYTVGAVPAVVATDFDVLHTVVSTEDETATDRAEHDAKREERLAASHGVLREGTPEADRSEPATLARS